MIYKTIRKDVKVNGKRAHEDTILQEGDQVVSVHTGGETERSDETADSQSV